MQKLVKTQKSTNNPMSSFGLIEKNLELSHIYLAVQVEPNMTLLTVDTVCKYDDLVGSR